VALLRQVDFHAEELRLLDTDLGQAGLDRSEVLHLMSVPGINATVAGSIVAAVARLHPLPHAGETGGLPWAQPQSPPVRITMGSHPALQTIAGSPPLTWLLHNGRGTFSYLQDALPGTSVGVLPRRALLRWVIPQEAVIAVGVGHGSDLEAEAAATWCVFVRSAAQRRTSEHLLSGQRCQVECLCRCHVGDGAVDGLLVGDRWGSVVGSTTSVVSALAGCCCSVRRRGLIGRSGRTNL
jgi:hypothetical protein